MRIRSAFLFALLLAVAGSLAGPLSGTRIASAVPGQVAVEGPSRGYTTTPQELRAIAQKAAQGIQPYASAVNDVMSWAGRSWSFSLAANATCPNSDEPAWSDNKQGIPILYSKALAYHLTGDAKYANEVRGILQRIMTEVRTISLDDRQCQLNFGWATPELVAAADLIEDRFKGQTCTGPLTTTYGNTPQGSGDCKRLFQNWLAKNPYYVVSLAATSSMNNWGAAATNTTAYIADYLIDRSDITLVHRNPRQINGGRDSTFTPLQAYQHANRAAFDRMNGYAVDFGTLACDALEGAQQSSRWTPVKSQITERGIVPEEARRTEYCNIPTYNGLYQNYPQLHLNNVIQQCELMLRRGDSSCFDNVDNTNLPNFSYPDSRGRQRTTHLRPGRGSIERAINAIIIDSRTPWQHDSALQVAYRYYKGHSRLGGVGQWTSALTQRNQCSQGICFGLLTHGFASNEQPSLPPVAPMSPIGGGAPPQPTSPAPSATFTPTQRPTTTPVPSATVPPTQRPTTTPVPSATVPPTRTPVPTTPPPAQPTGVPSALTFQPTDDAQVKSSRPTSNYGSQADLRVRLTSSEDIDSYLKFNVTGVSGSVRRVTLLLYVTDGSPDGGTLYAVANTYKGSSTAWTESGINWNNAPAILGSSVASAGAVKPNTWVELDVTAAVRGNGVYSFALTSSSTDSALYNSREATTNRPTLVIETGSGSQGSAPTPTQLPPATVPPPAALVPPTAVPTTSPPVGQSPSLTLQPSDDAQVKSSRPTSNYGSQTDLRVRLTSSEQISSYLKFNVTGVTGPVQRATLRLFVTDGSPDGGSLYSVANTYKGSAAAWTESGITWDNAPVIRGRPLASAGAVADGVWIELDVTSTVRGNGVYSFALTSTSSNSALFNSKEARNNLPALVIETGGAQPRTMSAAEGLLSDALPADELPDVLDDNVLPDALPADALPEVLPAHVLPTEVPPVLPAPAELPVGYPAGQRIVESDAAEVVRTAGWVVMSNPPGASGGSFLANTSAAETLTFQFTGTSVEVGYVENQAFGVFIIEIDGQPVQMVDRSSEANFLFGRRAVVAGLGDTAHTLRILPQNSVVAIDYFAVPAPVGEAEIVIVPTEVPLPPVEAPAIIVPPVVESEPVDLPTEGPQIVPPVMEPAPVELPTEGPQIMPTVTPTPLPVLLPLWPVSVEQFAIMGAWQASAEMQWLIGGDEAGTLMIAAPLDLRLATAPAVLFSSWLNAVSASAGVQVSLDGLAWQTLSVIQPTAEWQPLAVDLSTYRGQVVWLRWIWLPQPSVEPLAVPDSWLLAGIQIIDVVPTPEAVTPVLMPTLEAPPVAPFEPALPVEPFPTPEVVPPAEPATAAPPMDAEATAEPGVNAQG